MSINKQTNERKREEEGTKKQTGKRETNLIWANLYNFDDNSSERGRERQEKHI